MWATVVLLMVMYNTGTSNDSTCCMIDYNYIIVSNITKNNKCVIENNKMTKFVAVRKVVGFT